MAEERQDDLYGAIGVRNLDIVKRQLENAAIETRKLQQELDKIDINVSDETFVDTTPVTLDKPQTQTETLDISPEITIKWKGITATAGNIEDAFKQIQLERSKTIEINIGPPKALPPHRPRTVKRFDLTRGFDPARPEEGETINFTSEILERIRDHFTDRDDENNEMIFWLKPEEFINLAMPLYSSTSLQSIDEKVEYLNYLKDKIFADRERKGTFASIPHLIYNVDTNQITGHEGRHRAFAVLIENLERDKNFKIPVNIQFYAGKDRQYNQRPDVIPIVPLIAKNILQERNLQYKYTIGEYPKIDPSSIKEGQSPKELIKQHFELMEEYHVKLRKLEAKEEEAEIAQEMLAERTKAKEAEVKQSLEDYLFNIQWDIASKFHDDDKSQLISDIIYDIFDIDRSGVNIISDDKNTFHVDIGETKSTYNTISNVLSLSSEFIDRMTKLYPDMSVDRLKELLRSSDTELRFKFPGEEEVMEDETIEELFESVEAEERTTNLDDLLDRIRADADADEEEEEVDIMDIIDRIQKNEEVTSKEIDFFNEWKVNQDRIRKGMGMEPFEIKSSDEYKGKIETSDEHMDIDDLLNEELEDT